MDAFSVKTNVGHQKEAEYFFAKSSFLIAIWPVHSRLVKISGRRVVDEFGSPVKAYLYIDKNAVSKEVLEKFYPYIWGIIQDAEIFLEYYRVMDVTKRVEIPLSDLSFQDLDMTAIVGADKLVRPFYLLC